MYGPFQTLNVSVLTIGVSIAWDPGSGIWIASAGISRSFGFFSIGLYRTNTAPLATAFLEP